MLTLALALGTAACGPEAGNGNGNGGTNCGGNGGTNCGGNGNGNGNGGNGGNGGGAMDVAVVAGVTDVMPMGFTLTLQPGVPGIVPQDLTLMPAVAIATATANTGDMPNTRYTVATEALLAPNQEYTLTIAKVGYDITSPTFMRSASSTATITKMTLTVSGLKVEGSINGTDITFPYGARGAGGTPTLTGVVSLALSAEAEEGGTSLVGGTQQTYTTTPKNITVRAEDGTTTKTYTVATKAYVKASNPYGVYTPAHLYEVRNGLSDGYRLMQDVTLPDTVSGCSKPSWAQTQDNYCTNGFSPIGTYSSSSTTVQFTGTFDGNGHVIRNLSIGRSAADYVGLFGYIDTSAEIRDLGVHIAAAGVIGKGSVGGLVGYSGGTITNCYATGAVSGSSEAVGGLAGRSNGTITNSYATGAVTGSSEAVGGLAGRSNGTITNSYATGTVSGTDLGNSDRYVGGLVGYSDGTITNSYATGAVTGSSAVGGLLGISIDGTITNCYATGAVTGSSNVGGLTGNSGGTITNCYATGAVTGNSNVGGLVGSSDGTMTNSYATGAVSGGSDVGGLVGSSVGTITTSYYPTGRPAGAGGTTRDSGAGQGAFSGFAFTGTTPTWKRVEGQWPQLNGFTAAQTTPSLTYHTAAVTAPSATQFTITLVAPLNNLTEDDWALYSSSGAAVMLTGATTADNGANYVFTATLTADTYNLLYTKADVIVVPKTSTATDITVDVPPP